MIIHKDLSGEVISTITLPDSLISSYSKVGPEFDEAKLRARFDALSGVKLLNYSKSNDRRPVVKLHISFSSLEKLNEALAANKPAGILGGEFTVSKADGKTSIVRKLGVGEPISDLPQQNWVQYKTHFDGKIANTNSGFYDQANSDVRYRFKLTEILANQPTQETVLARALPWKWIFICLVVIAAAAYYGWELTKKKKVVVNPQPLHATRAAAVTPPGATPQAAPAPAPAPAPPSAGPQRPAGPPRPQRPGPPQNPGPGPSGPSAS